MASRFDISAGELKLNLEAKTINEEKKEDVPIVTLAPFTNNTKVDFENVTIGSICIQKVIVENPSSQALKVAVKSLPPIERNVTISWEVNTIPPNDSILFEIRWNPIEVDSWRHTITFQFGRSSKKDLQVTFKSVGPKKIIKKQTTKKKSPKRSSKQNGTQTKLMKASKPHRPIIKSAILEEKENVFSFQKSSQTQFCFDNISSLNSRRDTYTKNDARFYRIHENFKNISNDSLELSDLNSSEIDSNSDNYITKKKLVSFKSNSPTELHNMSSATYIKGNLSTATYVKENICSDTYTQGNISTETYIKGDISSNTYVKDGISPTILRNNTWTSRRSSSFISNLNSHIEDDINLSPIFNNSAMHQKNMSGSKIRKIIEANMWENEKWFHEYSPERHPLKRKSDVVFDISPAKRVYLGGSSSGNQYLDWNKTKKIQKTCNYFDPYMSESAYHNKEWMDKQEDIFKNWLNSLLTPPSELNSNIDQPINVAKLWQECKKQSVPIAPSKETVSNKYHTNNRLDALRKSALILYKSNEVVEVLAKIVLNVENLKLSIRTDKNVHLDLGLQSEVMTLLLSYNPLWLRIGLETIYNLCITLNSNCDIMGLSNFLMQNFFKDSTLLRKHKTVHTPKYAFDIKKFILKKFLTLVYFLDLAKSKTLIGHDPCLFRRNAPVKESREILLGFSRELLSSVGDVTRLLRFMGYVVNHKQTYIQEFNYSVVHLGVDLRDGVRLTKVMEIILMRNNLTECLRVPAVSRLQKIHNMKLVFDALSEANFEIVGEIGPKDVVDGHHEKTLSFLWQIIYKFQAPLMVNSAIKIQKWWRTLPIVLIRRIRQRLRIGAAITIQKWYRRHLLALKIIKIIPLVQDILRHKLLTTSAIIIQKNFKMHLQKKRYEQLKMVTLLLQSRVRGYLIRKSAKHKLDSIVTIQAYVRMWIKRKQYLRICASVIYLQQVYRAKQLMVKQREKYQRLKASALLVQELYRGKRVTKITRQRYLTIKASIITIQLRFRAIMLMKTDRNKYQQLRNSCVTIQKHYRSYRLMKKNFQEYGDLKRAVLTIQRIYRAKIEQRKLVKAAITIQQRFIAKKKMQVEYQYFRNLRKYAVIVQNRYRAKKLMQIQRRKYQELKMAVIIIQQLFKSKKLTNIEQTKYQKLRNATKTIQQRFKAHCMMKIERSQYQKLKSTVIVLQRKYRAVRMKRVDRVKYIQLRNAAIVIQQRYRAYKLMQIDLARYKKLNKATICIQQRFKAKKKMQVEYQYFRRLRKYAVLVQNRYRAKKLMQIERRKYQELKMAVIIIQRLFKSKKLTNIEQTKYQKVRNATKTIQQRFKAYCMMKIERSQYQKLKSTVIVLQRKYRAVRMKRVDRVKYIQLRNAAIVIQQRYRAYKLMQIDVARYKKLNKATICIQQRFKAKKKMQVEYQYFRRLRKYVVIVQNRYRANKLMQIERRKYQEFKMAVIIIQRLFKSKKLTNIEQTKYQKVRNATKTIQQRFRANCMMKIERSQYQKLKSTVIVLQRKYRAVKMKRVDRVKYIQLRDAAIVIQQRYRARQLMKIQYERYQLIRSQAIYIQRKFRSNQAMKVQRALYQRLRQAVLNIQRRFRAITIMKIEYTAYCKYKKAAITIQRRFRSQQLMKTYYARFCQIKRAAVIIQRNWRRFTKENVEYKKKKLRTNAAVKLQSYWRGYTVRRDHPEIQTIRKSVEVVTLNASSQNTLQNRKERAIQILTDTSTLLQILHALEDLDFITRRCKNTLMSMSGILPEQLYIFISSANRSPAEMELSTVAVSILINFYKFQDTSKHAWVPARINNLILVMTHCCDKEDKLFPYLCTLIWLFAHEESHKQFICSLPTFRSLFTKINCLCLRKQKMVSRKNPSVASYFRPVSVLPQPLLVPDWGLDYPDKPRTFMNSIHALTSVLNILDY